MTKKIRVPRKIKKDIKNNRFNIYRRHIFPNEKDYAVISYYNSLQQ